MSIYYSAFIKIDCALTGRQIQEQPARHTRVLDQLDDIKDVYYGKVSQQQVLRGGRMICRSGLLVKGICRLDGSTVHETVNSMLLLSIQAQESHSHSDLRHRIANFRLGFDENILYPKLELQNASRHD